MNIIRLIGLVAGVLTTISFLPQVIKTWKEKKTKDISLAMYSIFCLGIFLWVIYGFLINDLPVIATNIGILSLASIILFFKIKYK